jgi:CheY-like chemotaxis protein
MDGWSVVRRQKQQPQLGLPKSALAMVMVTTRDLVLERKKRRKAQDAWRGNSSSTIDWYNSLNGLSAKWMGHLQGNAGHGRVNW